MTRPEGFARDRGQPSPPARRPLLTPKAAAIAGLVFAVLSMGDGGSWTTAIQSFIGMSFGSGEYAFFVTAGGFASLALAVSGIVLGRRAFAHTDDAWESHLGRAAVMVAWVGAALASVTIVAGFVAGS